MTGYAEELLAKILAEQKKANDLLVMLIDALADEGDAEGEEPSTYLDGRKVR